MKTFKTATPVGLVLLLACGDLGPTATFEPSDFPTETSGRGLVVVQQTRHVERDRELVSHSFRAEFSAQQACLTEAVGACVKKDCRGVERNDTLPQAGAILVSGGAFPAVVQSDAQGRYRTIGGSFAMWDGEESLQISADGGDISPFIADVPAPASIELTSPLLVAPPFRLRVFRSHLLAVTWTVPENAEGTAHVVVTNDDGQVSVECAYDVSVGQARIPAEALADLPAGDGTFRVDARNTVEVAADDYLVEVRAQHTAAQVTGEIAYGAITLE